ncbi:MAG: rane protein of unknown function [Candidatus Saccharibacteria bacterium]|nr:rane protein of unknown function [Candidatus Saccharibacteria bacterium]
MQMKKIDTVYLFILLVIFGGIVLQAPISVGLGTVLPHYDLLIKSWAEILMLVAAILAVIILKRTHRLAILKEPLMIGIGIYVAIYALSLVLFGGEISSVAAGLAIDLRYILFFVLVYIALRLFPHYRLWFIKIGIAGALVVMIFALLQVFVLPADILKYIGYNTNTIAPYLTVDQNHDFIRINSTLRGPNPLGAYAGIVIALLLAFWLRAKHAMFKIPLLPALVLLIGGLVALWVSYSRSALIGAALAVVIVLAVSLSRKLNRRAWIIGAVIIFAVIGGLFAATNSTFVSNVFLHENPLTGSSTNSNQGHISSLQDGILRFVVQPFGAGVGSTGSASLHTNAPLIIENQYLFTAHEAGWLGLAFFLMIFIGIMSRLWQRRSDWLALGVFASGIGLAAIGLLLPVWVDDTVAIVWWGLAAIAIGGRHE